MSIEDLKNRLAKACKGVQVDILAQSDVATVKEFFPTPSYDLNRILTGSLFKGVGSKTFTLMVGPEASFKSSFMCLCAAEAQRQGYTPVIFDTEGAWTGDFIKRWGMDPDNAIIFPTPWVEEIIVGLGQFVSAKDQKLCIIIDSIGGMESSKMVDDAEKGDVKADQGQLTRKIKRIIKMALAITKLQNSVAFGSAHLYANVSGYGDADLVGGGKFVKLGPDTIIMLKKNKIQEDTKEKKVTGNLITATTIKNRFYPAYSEATIELDYKHGVNPVAGMVPLAIEAGLITQGGAWYTNTLSGEKFQGEANVEKAITPEMLKAIDEWIQQTGYSTYNKNVEAAIEAASSDIDEEGVEDALASAANPKKTRSLRGS